MANNDSRDQEPSAPAPDAAQAQESAPRKKSREILTKGRAELSESELTNPGVLKLLINELDRSQDEIERLLPYVEKFHAVDKDLAVMKEKEAARKSRTFAEELLSSGTLAIGFGLVGAVPSMTNHQTFLGIAAGVLILISIVAKWKLK